MTLGGNPVLSTPNGGRLQEALGTLDLLVSIDPWVNETSRLAHFILPPASPLTRDHYDLVFHLLAVRNTAKFSEPVFPKPAGARHDWEILLGLSDALARKRGRDPLAARATRALLRRLGPAGLVSALLQFGPYGGGVNPFGRGLSLASLRAQPSGVDLGALEPCLPARLYTEDRRIHLAPDAFVADLPRLRAWMESLKSAPATALTLIGRRHLRSNNSWMHNVDRLMKGADRCTLLIHPDDARTRDISSGQRVRVTSKAGAVEVAAEVTDAIRQGVVCLPHGFGHERSGVRLAVARRHAGASYNDLTDDTRLDELCGTAAFSGTPVEVVLVERPVRLADDSAEATAVPATT